MSEVVKRTKNVKESRTNNVKESRTLLVNNFPENYNPEFSGLKSYYVTKNNLYFLVFNDLNSSTSAFNMIKESNYNVKHAYYKLFFRFQNVDLETIKYDDLKKEITDKLMEIHNISVLYFKFYIRNNKFIGTGDFTIDWKEDMDKLLTDKTLNIDDTRSISLYRFRSRKIFDTTKQINN